MIEYTIVKIPMNFATKITNSKVFKDGCYRSVSEFVLDSARRRIE